jgi:hypothetical protein
MTKMLNWVIPVIVLPLWGQSPPPASRPAATDEPAKSQSTAEAAEASEVIDPPREPSASEILEALSKDADEAPRPVILPSKPGQTVYRRADLDPSALPANAIQPTQRRLYPDGYRIVDRPGRLTREGDYYVFSIESRSDGPPEPPIRVLPNRLLEDMEIASAGGTISAVFLVSGELTAYHGVNYLLVQKLLTRPKLGNLK